MADYEQEQTHEPRKKRKGILPLLLLLALLLLGLWFLFLRNDDNANNSSQNEAESSQSTQQTDDAQQSQLAAAVTSTDDLLNPADAASLEGRTVDIKQAPVYTVIGDRSFTVGTAEKYVYALLAENLDQGGAEGNVQVKAGEPRQLSGTVKTVPADTATLAQTFQLNETQVQELKTRGYYVEVQATTQE